MKKAEEIGLILNDFSFSAKKVAEDLTKEHSTLQQSFTRLAIEWLKICASEDYSYDGRNEASHQVAKQLIPDAESFDYCLPFI